VPEFCASPSATIRAAVCKPKVGSSILSVGTNFNTLDKPFNVRQPPHILYRMTLEEFTAQLNAITFWKEFTFSETRLGREKTISRPIHPFYAATSD
jgi:hypothetical protein